MDAARQRRRLAIAMGITVVCAILAMGAIVAGFITHRGVWMNLVVAAIVVGVGAQIWLIAGVLRDR